MRRQSTSVLVRTHHDTANAVLEDYQKRAAKSRQEGEEKQQRLSIAQEIAAQADKNVRSCEHGDGSRHSRFEREKAVQRAWADVVRKSTWDYVVTLTFSFAPTASSAKQELRAFLSRLNQRAGRRVSRFFTLERGNRTGRLHAHGVIGNVAHLSADDIRAAWKAGFEITVEAHRPGEGFIEYMFKDATREDFDFDYSHQEFSAAVADDIDNRVW